MGFKVNVKGTIGEEQFISIIEANGNQIISDEPEQLGGQNKGFNPFELVASGLSACTLATLRGYIDRKGWVIPEFSVKVELESFPKDNKAVIKTYLDFKDAVLTDKQKTRLFQIAEKCPVHKLLSNDIEILTELKSDLL